MFKGWIAAIFTIIVWGVTFASTRALLEDFSSLEINIARFALAWVALACAAKVPCDLPLEWRSGERRQLVKCSASDFLRN